MNTWPAAPFSPSVDAAEQACLAGLIDQLGEPGFAQAGLGSLNRVVRAGSWSVYRLRPRQTPLLHLSAAYGVPDTTRACFAAYADGLYRDDASFDPVLRQRHPGQALVLKMGADEAPSSEHRDAIYRRHGVLERLSVAQLEPDGSLLAVNLYRHGPQGAFDPPEQESFRRMALLLLASVRRHVRLLPAVQTGGAPTSPSMCERLRARCPALTQRELDVCERLLRGWSHDGIAADMGLSVATVKTYRARAFARLGLHFRSELFALMQA